MNWINEKIKNSYSDKVYEQASKLFFNQNSIDLIASLSDGDFVCLEHRILGSAEMLGFELLVFEIQKLKEDDPTDKKKAVLLNAISTTKNALNELHNYEIE